MPDDCPKCSLPLSGSVDKFCHRCGPIPTPPPSGITCSGCGGKNGPSDSFCSNCGKPLSSDLVAASPTLSFGPYSTPNGQPQASVPTTQSGTPTQVYYPPPPRQPLFKNGASFGSFLVSGVLLLAGGVFVVGWLFSLISNALSHPSQSCESYTEDWIQRHPDSFERFGKLGQEAAQTYLDKAKRRDERGETDVCKAELDELDKNLNHFIEGWTPEECQAKGGIWNPADKSCTINLPPPSR